MTTILTVFLCFFWAGAQGQGGNDSRARFQASAVAGLNVSQIDGDDLNGFHQPGLNAGLRVVAVLGDRWRVGPELLFSQLGARRNTNSINSSPYDRFRLNTVEVPLMVYYKDWRVTAQAGGSYARVIDFSVLDSGGQDVTETRPLAEELYSIKLGAGIYLTPNLSLNVRWTRGLNNVNDFGRINMRTRTVSVRAAWTFGDGETW